jgi:hypothetical protein
VSHAAATWSAYYVAAGMAKRGERGGWDVAAQAHLDAHWDAVELEAQESVFDLGPRWHGLGTIKAWCFMNPLDHRPINRERWAKKRKARY